MNEALDNKLAKLADLQKAQKRQIHPIPPPEKCDSCSKNLSDEKYYIDGALKNSTAWANMCPKCFFENGEDIGWGSGQLYMQEKKGSWLLVAGFPSKDKKLKDGSICNFCGEEYPKEDLLEVKGGEFACRSCMDNADEIMGAWLDQQKTEESK